MSATFTYNLMMQLAGVINRDILTYLSPFGYSENFTQFDLVDLWPQSWPALLICESVDDFDPESEQTFKQTVNLRCRVQLSEVDRNICAQKMRGYLGALVNLFAYYDWQRHAADLVAPIQLPISLAQLIPGGLTPGVTANVTRIFARRITMDEFGVKGNGFLLRSTVHVVINQEEVL